MPSAQNVGVRSRPRHSMHRIHIVLELVLNRDSPCRNVTDIKLSYPLFPCNPTMFLNRLHRALSSFNHVTHRWAAIPLRDPHHPITQTPSSHAIGKQSLSLTSWNIQAWPVARSKLILDHILKGPKSSDIIHLQEVASSVRQSLLDDPRVRSGFLTTDAEDATSFKRRPATMTLLSTKRFGSPLLDEEGEGGGS
jgi:tyrosyl-DNA phosphodiesterase 2